MAHATPNDIWVFVLRYVVRKISDVPSLQQVHKAWNANLLHRVARGVDLKLTVIHRFRHITGSPCLQNSFPNLNHGGIRYALMTVLWSLSRAKVLVLGGRLWISRVFVQTLRIQNGEPNPLVLACITNLKWLYCN
jgi:hypothetical protein